MHDCPKIQEKLFDLVFSEIDLNEQKQILADVSVCSLCQAELESLEKTLLFYDQAIAFNEPTAAEWQIYERNLQKRFTTKTKVFKPFWHRVFFASVRVPAPVFAAITLLICAAAFFALRSVKQDAPQAVAETVQPPVPNTLPIMVPTPEKIIVREERVVTRKIYVANRANIAKQSKSVIAQNPINANLSPLNLAEFKPVRPIAPSVVKE